MAIIDPEDPAYTLSQDVLDAVCEAVSRGASGYDVYYRVCRTLPSGYTKKRFLLTAATRGTPLSRAIDEGNGLFEMAYAEKLLNQMDEKVASASKVLAEQRHQKEIDAAVERAFPGLFPTNDQPYDD